MNIGRKLYVSTAKDWRVWLKNNHAKAKEIWLVYPKAGSGKPRIPYNDAVEQALCFGWIDSTTKAIDEKKFAQRFSPRRDPTNWSQHNIERMHRMIAKKLMTPAGLAVYKHHTPLSKTKSMRFPEDIVAALKADPMSWKHFKSFPASYQRIRIANIEYYRSHGRESFMRRLNFFLKKTRQGKRVGFGHGE